MVGKGLACVWCLSAQTRRAHRQSGRIGSHLLASNELRHVLGVAQILARLPLDFSLIHHEVACGFVVLELLEQLPVLEVLVESEPENVLEPLRDARVRGGGERA